MQAFGCVAQAIIRNDLKLHTFHITEHVTGFHGETAIVAIGFNSLMVKMLRFEKASHLAIDTAKVVEVAVRRHSVGAYRCLLERLESRRGLPHVMASPTQQVVCPHLFIRRAVAVIIIRKHKLEAVGEEDGVAFVLCHEAEELPSAESAAGEFLE